MCEITAHSGCDGTPDNSMEFVRYALASEGNCLEADIRRNRDGELILSHDETAEEAVRLGQVFELLKWKSRKKDQLRSENAGAGDPRIPAGKGVWRGGTADLFRYGEFLFHEGQTGKISGGPRILEH